jgi:hypothetical protein
MKTQLYDRNGHLGFLFFSLVLVLLIFCNQAQRTEISENTIPKLVEIKEISNPVLSTSYPITSHQSKPNQTVPSSVSLNSTNEESSTEYETQFEWEPFSKIQINQLCQEMQTIDTMPERMIAISDLFLGTPYGRTNIGALEKRDASGNIIQPAIPEVYVINLGTMDCVTFPEYVLALAYSNGVEDFIHHLRHIKYYEGTVDYTTRNHYMIHWTRWNEKQGYVKNITSSISEKLVHIQRDLTILEGLGHFQERFAYIPMDDIASCIPKLQDGDLIYLVSSRDDLDVQHVVMAHWIEGQLHIRHAKSRNQVLDDLRLLDYLANRSDVPGIIVVRPLLPH